MLKNKSLLLRTAPTVLALVTLRVCVAGFFSSTAHAAGTHMVAFNTYPSNTKCVTVTVADGKPIGGNFIAPNNDGQGNNVLLDKSGSDVVVNNGSTYRFQLFDGAKDKDDNCSGLELAAYIGTVPNDTLTY